MGEQIEEAVIPKTCKAGCVVNAGADFTISVEDVPVPEPGIIYLTIPIKSQNHPSLSFSRELTPPQEKFSF